ncbi:hypothetical protein BKA64DRAFT_638538 [Cadophora sp. MPI-SDFR-AT-0126]|nr:hypothetical protein BKA64DRAFT_638538 [Leotiomycetes sp. MPI-SDFR-AT-0126]
MNSLDMRPYKKSRLLNSLDDIITLEVGEAGNPTKLAVHKAILCSSSPFFESACKPEWMTAGDPIIKLPVDDPIAVRAMVHWMYHNVICISPEMDDLDENDTEEDAMKTPYGLFANLFVLGEKYQMPRLENHAIDAIIHRHDEGPNFAIGINSYVYANTSDDSPLRKVLVGLALRDFQKADIIAMRKQLCQGFIFDLALVPFSEELCQDNIEAVLVDFCGSFHMHSKRNAKCKALKMYTVGP